MNFEKQPISWENKGTEPTEDIKQSGFTVGYKPPAAYHNFLFALLLDCIAEIQKVLSDTNFENSVDNAINNSLATASENNIVSVSELINDLNSKAASSHQHSQSQISGLSAALSSINTNISNLNKDKLNAYFVSNGYVGMDEVTSKIDELENASIKRITNKNTEISSHGGMYYVMTSAAINMPVITDAFLVIAFDDYDTTVGGNSTWRFIATDLHTGKRYCGSGDDTSNTQAFNTSIRWTEI